MTIRTQDVTSQVKTGIRTLWWLFLLRGVFGVVFGILALVNGPAAAALLAIILGVYVLLDGVVTLFAALAERKRLGSIGWYVVQALLSMILGVVILLLPLSFATLIGYIIIWAVIAIAVFAGIVGLRISLAARHTSKVWGWGVFGNSVSIAVGVLLTVLVFTNTEELMHVLIIIVGIWSLVVGLALVVWAFVARKFLNEALKSLKVSETTVS